MSAWRTQIGRSGRFFRLSELFPILYSLAHGTLGACGCRTAAVSRPARLAGLACAGLGIFLLGCQTAGPHLHSKADRVAYANLSSEDRLSVDAGLLLAGMPPETVKLAWGKPTVKRAFVEDGQERIVWLYYGTYWVDQPVWETVYIGRYGSPYLDYRVYRVGIPFVRARAVFEAARLIDWEQSQPPG